jgi:hypothetical protein
MTNIFHRVAIFSFITILLASCNAHTPKSLSEVVTEMTKYGKERRYDQAIRVGQDWAKKHPDDIKTNGLLYEQIAIVYLMKASKDSAHKDEWIQQAIANLDEALSVYTPKPVDFELHEVGLSFEMAGRMSTSGGCLYYGRAAKAFEEEAPLIVGDSITAYGKTLPLAPLRRENEKALARVKAESASAGCK